MKNAIREALKNLNTDDLPIGCVIKLDNKIIASAHNLCEIDKDVTSHAEIIAIKKAQISLGSKRLNNCEMYVTLEPCPMCSWAILQSGIKTLYFGSYNKQYGAMGSVLDLPRLLHSKIRIYGGIEEEQCDKIINKFWEHVRNSNRNQQ